jgi:AraC-like DNA-binding protein
MDRMEPLVFLTPHRFPECSAHYDRKVVGFHLQLTQGPLELAFDERVYNLDGEWLWGTEPGPRVQFQPVGGSTWFHRHVGFMGTRVLEWRKAGLWPPKPSPTPAGNDWSAAFDELFELVRHTDGWSRHRATNMVERILMEAADAQAVAPPADPWLDEVVRLLEVDEFSPDYASIAAKMGLSESALRRRFKRESGELAIHEYVVLNRLGKAKTLLENTNMTLAQIAEACGYGSEAFFARQFRAYASMPPGQYRKFVRSDVP